MQFGFIHISQTVPWQTGVVVAVVVVVQRGEGLGIEVAAGRGSTSHLKLRKARNAVPGLLRLEGTKVVVFNLIYDTTGKNFLRLRHFVTSNPQGLE